MRNQLDPTEAHRRRGAHTRALCAVPRDSGALTCGSATAPDGSPTFRSASGTPTFSSTQLLHVPSISDCSTRGAKGRAPWGQGTGCVNTGLRSPRCTAVAPKGPLTSARRPELGGVLGCVLVFLFPKEKDFAA